jgi:hypothetical protein
MLCSAWGQRSNTGNYYVKPVRIIPVALQHIQRKLKSGGKHGSGHSRAVESMEADTQEWWKAWKRTLKSGRKHGSRHSRAAESMEADTQERRIILEFTQQVSKCSEQGSVAFKGDKFEVLIIFCNIALNNPKPMLFGISNDYLTLNCFKRVTIFTGQEFC